MTHCAGYRAAAVARSGDLAAVGIDAEPHAPLPPDVLELVARPEERVELTALEEARPDLHWDRILFSAKEAVFKAWFPLTRRWLDFTDVGTVPSTRTARSGRGRGSKLPVLSASTCVRSTAGGRSAAA